MTPKEQLISRFKQTFEKIRNVKWQSLGRRFRDQLWERKRALVGLVLLGVVLFLGYLGYLFSIIHQHFEGRRWDLPTQIYSDRLTLYPGLDLKSCGFNERLKRLSYVAVNHPTTGPGEYFQEKDRLEIYLHAFNYPNEPAEARRLRVDLSGQTINRLVRVTQENDVSREEEIFTEKLEPELISEFFGKSREERQIVTLAQVPLALQNAIITIEDQRFFEHRGVDPRAIARAIWVNMRAHGVSQGGSTLTQQLVKNFFLSSKRNLKRKINEAMMALVVESLYSKEEILECYLNEVYFGQRGSVAIHGVGEAAKYYFGKDVPALNLAEAAMLAAIVKGPGIYSPYKHPDKARERQKLVLEKMRDMGFVSDKQLAEALNYVLPLKKPYVVGSESAYFVDVLRRQLVTKYPEESLTWEGFKIFTSLDTNIQHIAQEELEKGLQNLEKTRPQLKRPEPLQGAVIVVQPQTGYILALSGGRNYGETQYNRALQAQRQPGSLFKPFVALTALTNQRVDGTFYTAITKLLDEAISIPLQTGDIWKPENYDKKYRGEVTLRESIEQSINIPMVRLAQEVGIDRIVTVAQKLGIESPLKAVPSLALGATEVTPFEMAHAYSTIANGGVQPELLSVREVVNQKSEVLEHDRIGFKEVVPAAATYVTTDLMRGVVERGTGKGIRAYGLTGPMAGKTGTSSDFRDAWFVGFTPDILCLVWVGFDNNQSLQLSGATLAVPIWTAIVKRILAGLPEQEFTEPPGVSRVPIDRLSLQKATKNCPTEKVYEEVFIAGTEPREFCVLHPERVDKGPGMWRRLKNSMGLK